MLKRKSDRLLENRANVRGGNGTMEFLHLFSKEEMLGKADICVTLTIHPGDSIGEHAHGPEAEIYYLLKGQLEVSDNGKILTMNEGDALFTGNGDTHCFVNKSNENAELFAIIVR